MTFPCFLLPFFVGPALTLGAALRVGATVLPVVFPFPAFDGAAEDVGAIVAHGSLIILLAFFLVGALLDDGAALMEGANVCFNFFPAFFFVGALLDEGAALWEGASVFPLPVFLPLFPVGLLLEVGKRLGEPDGNPVGIMLGVPVGCVEGTWLVVGNILTVGLKEGVDDGFSDGCFEGTGVGTIDGWLDGFEDGNWDG